MADDERPSKSHLRIAAQNTDDEIAIQATIDRLGWYLRDLTSNLLRVTRGAGKPTKIAYDCSNVLKAVEEYKEITGSWPDGRIATEALSIRDPFIDDPKFDRWRDEMQLADEVLLGSIQVVASRMLDQKLQIKAGENQMSRALRGLEALKKERAKEFAKKHGAPKPRSNK